MSGKDRRRRSFKRNHERNGPSRNTQADTRHSPQKPGKGVDPLHMRKQNAHSHDKNSLPSGRLRWTAPKPSAEPLPVLICDRCGKPIPAPNEALSDRKNGNPVHFDCAMAELAKHENLETGEAISYLGGGRFGVVSFNGGKGENGNFSIKKIVEWEDKEKRAQWRGIIADHYSIT